MESIVEQLQVLGFTDAEAMLRAASAVTDPQNGPPEGYVLTDGERDRDIYYNVLANQNHDAWQITHMYVTAQLEDSSRIEGVTVLQQSYQDSDGWPTRQKMLEDINAKINLHNQHEQERQEQKRQKQISYSIDTYAYKRRSR